MNLLRNIARLVFNAFTVVDRLFHRLWQLRCEIWVFVQELTTFRVGSVVERILRIDERLGHLLCAHGLRMAVLKEAAWLLNVS